LIDVSVTICRHYSRGEPSSQLETLEGRFGHRRVDQADRREVPEPDGSDDEAPHGDGERPETLHCRSVMLSAPGAESLLGIEGIEGMAAKEYFAGFAKLLKGGAEFNIEGRNRRPPRDPVNAMLSFVYAMLVKDRISYRRMLEVQARLLGRTLLGEIEQYPNFCTR
jgi:hypothetical protein